MHNVDCFLIFCNTTLYGVQQIRVEHNFNFDFSLTQITFFKRIFSGHQFRDIFFRAHSKKHVEKSMVSMAPTNNENDTNNDKIIVIADGQLN